MAIERNVSRIRGVRDVARIFSYTFASFDNPEIVRRHSDWVSELSRRAFLASVVFFGSYLFGLEEIPPSLALILMVFLLALSIFLGNFSSALIEDIYHHEHRRRE